MYYKPTFGEDTTIVDKVTPISSSLAAHDNTYHTSTYLTVGTLPIATASSLGVIIAGANLTIDVNGILNADGGAGATNWGLIGGTIGDQTDLTTALNLKANLAGPTFTGTVALPSTTSIGSVSSTEIGYLDNVTSAIQTQLNSKSPLSNPSFTGYVHVYADSPHVNIQTTSVGSIATPIHRKVRWSKYTGAEVGSIDLIDQLSQIHTTDMIFSTTHSDGNIYEDMRISNGAVNIGSTRAMTPTNWGYSAAYPVIMLGSYGAINYGTISIGYDPSGNADGSFSGDGREILFRNGVQFVTPNAANNAFNVTNLVLKDGNVGIGTATPTEKLHVVGNILATGEVTAYYSSDARLKQNIQSFSALDIIDKLQPKTFQWNDVAKELNSTKDDRNNYGLIAQEVEEMLPELIHPIYDKYKSVDYIQLIPIIIQAIKELKHGISNK